MITGSLPRNWTLIHLDEKPDIESCRVASMLLPYEGATEYRGIISWLFLNSFSQTKTSTDLGQQMTEASSKLADPFKYKMVATGPEFKLR